MSGQAHRNISGRPPLSPVQRANLELLLLKIEIKKQARKAG